MSFWKKIIGRPLATREQKAERIGPLLGIPLLGLDALSSSAYGPEAALTILLPLGAVGVTWIGPITCIILCLLTVLYLSYRQTISAYPNGGGSYTVARENLGTYAGLVAAASLSVDYILTVAVGISAGVEALTSAVPMLQPFTLMLCLIILAVLTLINLRGSRESGFVLATPTYAFIVALCIMLGWGIIDTVIAGGHPSSMQKPPQLPKATETFSIWLLLKAFASGCTAMTGVEAVSNGIGAFRDPAPTNAKGALTGIIATLGIMLAGIAYLCRAYGIGAMTPGSPHFESVLSQLTGAVEGKGIAYYITMTTIVIILCLSANTSFTGFPRLCKLLAEDWFLPSGFSELGRRLVYSHGIAVLTAATALLLVVFHGITDLLIPLYAIGAFSAFTLSQTGMVGHWLRNQPRKNLTSLILNGFGAIFTAIALAIVLVAKLTKGAWIVLILIPGIAFLLQRIRRHYAWVSKKIAYETPLDLRNTRLPLVVVVMSDWSKAAAKAMRFAYALSGNITVIHIHTGDEKAKTLKQNWSSYIEKPAIDAGYKKPRLIVVESPYRYLIDPLLKELKSIEKKHPDQDIAIILPELAGSRWSDYFFHNRRSTELKAALMLHGNSRMVLINVPFYLKH